MEEFIQNQIQNLPWETTPSVAWIVLFAIIGLSLAALGKGADWLVKEAVALSEHSGMPKVVIGATVVSLGTTTPEAAISVLAALQGSSELALGNAVGSIICDTGLILGLASLISPLQLHRRTVNRQGWMQIAAGFLLVACCFPWSDPTSAFSSGGHLSQLAGIVFVVLLAGYLWLSVRWAKADKDVTPLEELERDVPKSNVVLVLRLLMAIAVVIFASNILIPAVHEAALRLSIPPEIIASTLVAFGTSLPELVTAVTAARHGHGDLAIGNVVGADILNVLFVAGAAAAVTPSGLEASAHFFQVLFPAMIFILVVFRVGIHFSKEALSARFGIILLLAYLAVTVISYLGSH